MLTAALLKNFSAQRRTTAYGPMQAIQNVRITLLQVIVWDLVVLDARGMGQCAQALGIGTSGSRSAIALIQRQLTSVQPLMAAHGRPIQFVPITLELGRQRVTVWEHLAAPGMV